MEPLLKILSVIWEITKVVVLPVCLFLWQRAVNKMDSKRKQEREEADSKRKKEIEEAERLQYLQMQRMDKLSEMTHLMAKKLHDKGVINGDLQALDKKYKELDDEYEDEVHRLALRYSKK